MTTCPTAHDTTSKKGIKGASSEKFARFRQTHPAVEDAVFGGERVLGQPTRTQRRLSYQVEVLQHVVHRLDGPRCFRRVRKALLLPAGDASGAC